MENRPTISRVRRPARIAWMAMLVVAPVFTIGGAPSLARGDDANLAARDLAKLPLDQLFDVKVTSVSKHPEKLSGTASAIQILTAEDIRRSGATQLADVLRLAANVEVQEINSYGWVVSTRGFDTIFADKLLVMIDGRTVYTPLDAGVFWDAQNVLIEDIDRIEIISGPGGTLWGANAVNGVINIITKSARDTRGVYLSGVGGSFLQDLGAGRYGGRLGANTFYRVYGQGFERNGSRTHNGGDGNDAWNLTQGGFRVDSYPSSVTNWTLQGDAYAGSEFNTPAGTSTLDGQNLLGRWSRSTGEASSLEMQAYADRTWRHDVPSTFSDQLETYDVTLQHRFPLARAHSLLWGLGYRILDDDAPTSTVFVGFLPVRRVMHLFSAFLQDEVTLAPDRLKLTLGSKLEDGEFARWEAQPSVRLAWTPSARQTVWGAVSRALRAPSRIDKDYYIPTSPPFAIAGGPDFHSERLVAYELGYRVEPLHVLTLSLAGFYNHYDDLYSVESTNPPAGFPYTIQNGVAGQSYGAELSGVYQATPSWRWRGGYTWTRKDLWSRPGHDVLPSVIASLGNDPLDQATLQWMLDLGPHWQADATGRYVDALPNPHVPSYIGIDGRLAWSSRPWELSVVGQNLTQTAHPEFYLAREIPRSFYGRATVRW